jgi:cardiolipin synthase
MPAEPDRSLPIPLERRAFLKARAKLEAYDTFMLAGIAGLGADGRRKSIHVHATLKLVDDEWATVGSCKLHRFSRFEKGEMNVAFSEPDTVRAFRGGLFYGVRRVATDAAPADQKTASAD